MSRLNAIGNINRKYAGSGINQLAIDTSSNNVNPGDNFTSVNNNVVGNNLIGTSVLNADGRSSLDQATPILIYPSNHTSTPLIRIVPHLNHMSLIKIQRYRLPEREDRFVRNNIGKLQLLHSNPTDLQIAQSEKDISQTNLLATDDFVIEIVGYGR
jgi:hypothetical protein